jgi:hypothetical protein
MWNSIDRLAHWIFIANVGIAATLFLTFVLTAFVIAAGVKKDDLQKVADDRKDERISQTNALAQVAVADAENARKDQEKLRHDNLLLEERLRNAEQTGEKAQSKIAILEEERKPRVITSEQESKIIPLLSSFIGQEVEVRTLVREKEALDFSARVSEVLHHAGLKVNQTQTLAGPTGEGFGVVVYNGQSNILPQVIVFAFRSAGVGMGFMQLQQSKPTRGPAFFVGVGIKPTAK